MPLLCISLFALVLLPHSLSLSCGSKRPPTEIRDDYMAVVQTNLNDATTNIASLLQNASCAELKRRYHCTSDNTDVVSTLHNLTCKMMNLRLSRTEQLSMSVLQSIRCPCPEKPTKEPNVKSKKRRTATRKRRNEQRQNRRKTKKLCKANEILSSMTECYTILNTMLMGT